MGEMGKDWEFGERKGGRRQKGGEDKRNTAGGWRCVGQKSKDLTSVTFWPFHSCTRTYFKCVLNVYRKHSLCSWTRCPVFILSIRQPWTQCGPELCISAVLFMTRDGWMTSSTRWTWIWANSDGESWRAAVHGVGKESGTTERLNNIQDIPKVEKPSCPSAGKQNKYIHSMEYFSAIKGNEILTRATTWRNLDVLLSERSQSKRTTCCMIPLTQNVQSWRMRQKTG